MGCGGFTHGVRGFHAFGARPSRLGAEASRMGRDTFPTAALGSLDHGAVGVSLRR